MSTMDDREDPVDEVEKEGMRTPGSMDSSSDFDSNGASITNTPSRYNPNVKPALKKDDEDMGDNKRDRHLKWDEKVIEEHDQVRGTRMKIDEPNTPFAQYDSGAESDGSNRPKSPAQQRVTLSWDVLQTRLDSVAAVRAAYPSSPSSSHAGDMGEGDDNDNDNDNENDINHTDGEGRKKEMRKLEFQEHRKRHYNEMELVRRFRHEQNDDDDGDADVEDD